MLTALAILLWVRSVLIVTPRTLLAPGLMLSCGRFQHLADNRRHRLLQGYKYYLYVFACSSPNTYLVRTIDIVNLLEIQRTSFIFNVRLCEWNNVLCLLPQPIHRILWHSVTFLLVNIDSHSKELVLHHVGLLWMGCCQLHTVNIFWIFLIIWSLFQEFYIALLYSWWVSYFF